MLGIKLICLKCVGFGGLAAKYMCNNEDKGHFEECLSDNRMVPCEMEP